MSIPIRFQTVVIKKSAVRKSDRGGEGAFRTKYPCASEDRHLYGLAAMSGQEFRELLDALAANGLDPERSMATGEMFHGRSGGCHDVLFEQMSAKPLPKWVARLARDDPDVMAAEGARLYAALLERGWELDIPGSQRT